VVEKAKGAIKAKAVNSKQPGLEEMVKIAKKVSRRKTDPNTMVTKPSKLSRNKKTVEDVVLDHKLWC
jgi:hypothetical protein